MRVAYAYDDGYEEYAAVSAHSVAKHTSSEITFHSFTDTRRTPTMNKVERQHRHVQHQHHFVNAEKYKHLASGCGRFNYAPYYVLQAIQRIQPKPFMFLDVDTIILSDVDTIQSKDGKIQATVEACQGSYASRISGAKEYYNSGVLIVGQNVPRTDNVYEKAKRALSGFGDGVVNHDRFAVDQDVINHVYSDVLQPLHPSWNPRPQNVVRKGMPLTHHTEYGLLFRQGYNAQHFSGEGNPWDKTCSDVYVQTWEEFADELNVDYEPSPTWVSVKNYVIKAVASLYRDTATSRKP